MYNQPLTEDQIQIIAGHVTAMGKSTGILSSFMEDKFDDNIEENIVKLTKKINEELANEVTNV